MNVAGLVKGKGSRFIWNASATHLENKFCGSPWQTRHSGFILKVGFATCPGARAASSPDPTRECRCSGAIIQRYLSKVSGPLLDGIDLHIEVPAVPYKELRGKDYGVSSAEMRERVTAALTLQQQRGFYNAHIPQRLLRQLCALGEAGERTLEMAVRRMGLSTYAHDRILKVART